jgi:hypothetical protein
MIPNHSTNTGLRPSRLSAQAAASQPTARRRHFHVISGRGCRFGSRPVNHAERTSAVRSTRTSQRRILGVLFPPCLRSKGLQKQPRLITTICEIRQELLDELFFSLSQYRCPYHFGVVLIEGLTLRYETSIHTSNISLSS